MLGHLRRLSSQTLIYGLGDAVIRLAALFLLPIYTRFLSPHDYGKLAVVTLFSTIVALILDFGQRTALFRFYFDTEDPRARRRLTGTVLIFLLVAAAAILTPIILFFEGMSSSFLPDTSLVPLIQIALIGTFFDVCSTIPFAIFRAKQYAAKYAALSLARFIISVSLNITAIVVLHLGVVGLIYANLITSAAFFLICMAVTVKDIEWSVDFSLLKSLLRFGLPLIPSSLAYWALNVSDRFFLQKYRDLSDVGLYSISYVIAGVLLMIMTWFNTAYAPYCYSIAKDSDARMVYARVMLYVMTLLTLVGLGLSLFAREALTLLTPAAYHGAAGIVPFIVLAYLFFELYYLFSFGFDLTKKTGYVPLIIGTAAIINLCLNLILIPHFGMVGAAVATVLSYMLLPIIEYPVVRRLYPIPYEWRRLVKLATVSVATYLLGRWLKVGRLWIDLSVGVLLVLVWFLVLYLWRFFSQSELSAALGIGRTILGTLGKRRAATQMEAAGGEKEPKL
jgi:O-antigen/teichoic acid export membrane protein